MQNRFLLLLVLFLLSTATYGSDSDKAAREQIAARLPGVKVEDIRASVVPGLYEVMYGPVVFYTSADGRYMIRGEIHNMETDENITAARVDQARARSLAAIEDKDLIVFGPKNAPYTVTVFTDVTCTYCRMLHSQIDKYNELGIRVRYAAFPRAGLASENWQTMERVWCAPDRNKALTMAKQDQAIKTQACENEAVMEDWQLGRMLGVRGTPAIFTPSGEMIPGYLPPEKLLQRLKLAAAN